jgi:hypothetical protein
LAFVTQRDIRPVLVVVGGVGEEGEGIVQPANTVIAVRAYQAAAAPDQQPQEWKEEEVAHGVSDLVEQAFLANPAAAGRIWDLRIPVDQAS